MTELENRDRILKVEMGLLRAFIRICEELDLTYFAVQGTLLGAVRHRGMIPWDDDIDVGMLRRDYEIFLKKAPALLPEGYFLQSFHTDPEFYHCFAKLRDSRTTFIENTARRFTKMNQGIFIDIFPFDYYPEHPLDAMRFDLKKTVLRYRLRSLFYIPQDNIRSLPNMLRKFAMFTARILCPSERRALEESDRLFKSIRPGSRLINNGSPWGKREVVERVWMEQTGEHPFEDLQIRIPKGYDPYLKHVYGDYQQLPPEEERQPHHYAAIIDPETPYRVWMDRLAREV